MLHGTGTCLPACVWQKIVGKYESMSSPDCKVSCVPHALLYLSVQNI